MNVESGPRSLAVAAVVAVACSAMVATAVQVLRPLQQGYAQLERNRAIVDAAGMLPDAASERQVVEAYRTLDVAVIDIATGAQVGTVGDAYAFDHWDAAAPGGGEAAATGAGRVPVYVARLGGELHRVVLPIHGRGMWSVIYGYLALQPDLSTVADIVIFRHGETPGIGDRIQQPEWRARWRGKRVYDDDGRVRIRVVAGAAGPHEVDVISGASVTSEAVGELVRDWFGDRGYGRYLQRLRDAEASP